MNKEKQNSSNNNKIQKRPISILLVSLLGGVFLLFLLLSIFAMDNPLYNVSICLTVFTPIFFIISLVLLLINKRKNKRRTNYFIISTAVLAVLLIISPIVTFLTEDPYATANSYFVQEKYELAIEKYQEVINEGKDEDKIIDSENKVKEAEAYIKEAEEYVAKGNDYLSNDQFDEALTEYEKAYEIYPYLSGLKEKTSSARQEKNKQEVAEAEAEKKEKINSTLEETINNEPIAKIGFNEEELMKNKEVTFYSKSTDADNDILTYEWTLPDETISTEETVKYIFKNFGEFEISLKVSDGKSESRDSIKVNIENIAPTFEIDYKNSDLIKNKEVLFKVVANDPENGNLIYEWLLPDGTISNQDSFLYIFKEFGEYEISLTIEDGELLINKKFIVNINNKAPIASIYPSGNINCETGDTIHLSATDSLDPEGDELSFKWEFPDGSTSNKTEIDYTVTEVGIQSIKLEVSDGELNDSTSVGIDAKISEEYFKKSCQNVKYGELLRNPDEYIFKPIHVKGKIVQFLNNTQFHFNITKGSYGFWDDRAWLVLNNPPEENIIEDDIVEVWGFGGGNEEYETVMGATKTIPLIFAEYVEIIQKAD